MLILMALIAQTDVKEVVAIPGEADWFSRRGSLVLSADNFLSVNAFVGTSTFVGVQFRPSADLFIVDRLSLGATLHLGYFYANSGAKLEGVNTGIAARIGYDFVFSRRFGFWPTLALGVGYQRTYGATSSEGVTADLTINAPFLFHPRTNFFIGLGPFATGSWIGNGGPLQFGMLSTIGGHF